MDEAKVVATLTAFLEATDPYEYRQENSVLDSEVRRARYLTHPADNDEILRQNEIVRPILDRLFPEWRDEHANRSAYEPDSAEREAVKKLLARLETQSDIAEMLGTDEPRLSVDGLHSLISSAAMPAWASGQLSDAVDAAGRQLNAHLQAVVRRTDLSDKDLAAQAFSDKAPEPGKPRLRYPHIDDAQTRSSMEQGVRAFGQGCFQAIRNPLAHRPDGELELDEQSALERLAALSLFARWIDEATIHEA